MAGAIPVPSNGKLRPIDKIRAVFAAKAWACPVPEWDQPNEPPFVIYFYPLTMADLEAVRSGFSGNDEQTDQTKNVKLLVHKARDAQGQKMFFPGDIHYLMTEARADVITRICNFMYLCGSLTPDEARETLGNESTSATSSSSQATEG